MVRRAEAQLGDHPGHLMARLLARAQAQLADDAEAGSVFEARGPRRRRRRVAVRVGQRPAGVRRVAAPQTAGLPTRDARSGRPTRSSPGSGHGVVDRGRRGGAPRRRGAPRRPGQGGREVGAPDRAGARDRAARGDGSQQQGDRADACSSRRGPWAPTSTTRSPSSASPHAPSCATWLTAAAGRLTGRGPPPITGRQLAVHCLCLASSAWRRDVLADVDGLGHR